jgi:predicted transcriptional regulator
MKELTRAEEQIMQILWETGEGFVNDILEHFPEPKPAYNTVSTITRILVKKGFVGYHSLGKSHKYFPLVSKEEYTRTFFKRFVKNYFGDSYREMVSFFAREEDLSLDELEEIRQIMKKEIKKQKGK